jgi:hypothetical protein
MQTSVGFILPVFELHRNDITAHCLLLHLVFSVPEIQLFCEYNF